MALLNPVLDPTSNDVISQAYWRYTDLVLSVLRGTVTVTFAVYRSAAARDAGCEPVTVALFTIDGNSSPTFAQLTAADNSNPSGIGSTIYNVAKSLPQFSGATDA